MFPGAHSSTQIPKQTLFIHKSTLSLLHPHEAHHPPPSTLHFHTHASPQRTRAHTDHRYYSARQPWGHFHEKGECEESERSGPSICCTMWPPRREADHGSDGGTPCSQSTVCGSLFTPLRFSAQLKCSFLSSAAPQTRLVSYFEASQNNHRHLPSTNTPPGLT